MKIETKKQIAEDLQTYKNISSNVIDIMLKNEVEGGNNNIISIAEKFRTNALVLSTVISSKLFKITNNKIEINK